MREEKIKVLREGNVKANKYIIYWMQSAQRAKNNPALNYAIKRANQIEVPLIVFFNLTDQFPEANYRHYYFMLEGLQEVEKELAKIGIKFVVNIGDPIQNVAKLIKDTVILISDRGYLKIERKWKENVAKNINCRFVLINTNTIVPVDIASDKEEYAAYTIRKKITNKVERFLRNSEQKKLKLNSLKIKLNGIKLKNIEKIIKQLDIDMEIKKSNILKGGRNQAVKKLNNFIKEKLKEYQKYGSNPDQDITSYLSPYLHFGQISPSFIYQKVQESGIEAEDFLEQLVVRRELSFNFVYYNQNYDNSLVDILPNWAVKTLNKHQADQREKIYSLEDLENYKTHDPYWNAAQQEMVVSGYMNGYMRMYWGKKILEWTEDYQSSFQRILYLNNKYLLDGRDPNGFAGAAWIFGKHDRAWKERKIFGKVRYMNKAGLERKFNMEKYINRVDKLS